MNILFLSNVYPTPVHPTQGVFNAELVRALRGRGHAVRTLVPVPWRTWLPRWRAYARHTVPDAAFPPYWYPPGVMRWSYHRWLAWSIRRAVARFTRDQRADAVMAFWIHPDGRSAVEIAEAQGVPSVLIAGGSDLQVVTEDPDRAREVSTTLRRASVVLAVGRALADRAVQLGANPASTHVFRRGVDPVRFAPGNMAEARTSLGLPATQPIILWIGNLVAVKGVDLLLRAHASLAQPRPTLVLIGDGPDAPQLRTLTSDLRTNDDVRFVGRIAHQALATWIHAADVVALSSHSEGTPNVLLEASACGVPFVSTDVGSVVDLVTAADRIVRSRDPAAFGAAIADVLTTPGSRHGKVPVPRSWDDTVTQIEVLLSQPGRVDGPTSA